MELEAVLSTGRADSIMIAKSILMSSGIEHAVHGEHVQDIFGWGRFPAGMNLVTGPMRIFVRAEDAADARALLSQLGAEDGLQDDPYYEDARPDDSGASAFVRMAPLLAKGIAVAVIVLGVLAFVISNFV